MRCRRDDLFFAVMICQNHMPIPARRLVTDPFMTAPAEAEKPLTPKQRSEVLKTFLGVAPQLIASIVIPLTIAGMGWYYTRWQQNVADLKTMIDLVTESDKDKRKYGIAMFEYLLKNGKVPVEFVYAQLTYANSATDKDLLTLFELAIQNAGQENPEVLDTYKEALARLPSRIFFHVRDEKERQCLNNALNGMKDVDRARLTIAGTFMVGGYENKTNELRYLMESDAEKAASVAQMLIALGVPATVKDLSDWGKTARFVRPNTFELWIGDPGIPGCTTPKDG